MVSLILGHCDLVKVHDTIMKLHLQCMRDWCFHQTIIWGSSLERMTGILLDIMKPLMLLWILCVCDNTSWIYFSLFLFILWKKSISKKTYSWSFLFSRLLCQIVQAIIDYQLWCHHGSLFTFSLGDIPLLAWLLVSLSLMLVVVVNEVVKLHEIRYNSSHKTELKWENIHSKWQTGDINEMFNARYNFF